ncbi:hypothetical protein MnTg02_00985 [bacterium MnTg02]|nr:hypothetical protein MnTg02_00985 [bacterium MnTg02]
MTVETNHPIGFSHDNMQIMGNQQNSALQPIANGSNKLIKSDLTGKIHALHGFVQNQEIRFTDDRPRHQRALELAARQGLNRCIYEMADADGVKRSFDLVGPMRIGQCHEPGDRQGQRWINRQSLRHIADTQPVRLGNGSGGQRNQPQNRFRSGAFSTSIRTNERDDLATANRYVDTSNDPPLAIANTNSARINKCVVSHPYGPVFGSFLHR